MSGGSMRRKPFRNILIANRGEIALRIMRTARRLGFGEPKAFAVPQNTLVVADTVGFHARGLSARPSVRVEIWAYGRRNPFLPWLGFDPAFARVALFHQLLEHRGGGFPRRGPRSGPGQAFSDLGHAVLAPGQPGPSYNSSPPTSGASQS